MRVSSILARYTVRLLLLALALYGLAEGVVYLYNPAPWVLELQLGYGLVTTILIFYAGRAKGPLRARDWMTPALLGATFLVTVLIAQVALQGFANSADEYGYNYLADTLLHGRLWNKAYPPALRSVLLTNYIGGHGDQRLSQYAPGWPVVLMPFKALGIPQFANAVVGLIAAVFLLKTLRRLPVPDTMRLALVALSIASPFVVFNDASFFTHPLTAASLLAIIWLDIRDASEPARVNRVGIGLAFSILLTTRYEAFLISFALFAIDGLWRHRLRFVVWALPAVLGAAPITVLFLLYNWQITGSPLTTTTTWVSPGIGYGLYATGMDGPHSPQRAVVHTVEWFSKWQEFASVVFLPLYAVAVWCRLRARTLRWFDLLWPAVVIFFFFFPDEGGFQYGPRYWYIAYAAMPVTIAVGVPRAGELWRIGRWRLDPLRLAAAQLACFVGFGIGYALFLYVQTENRVAPFALARTVQPPALVLLHGVGRRYVPWQNYPRQLFAEDYTRNGLDDLPPIAIGRDLDDERTALLCTQLPDRAIYRMVLDRWTLGGVLVPVCNGAAASKITSSAYP